VQQIFAAAPGFGENAAMAKPRSLEGKLAHLRTLRSAPASPQRLEDLRAALGDAANLLVAEAAEIVGEANLSDLAPDLAAAFARFLDNPVKRDPLCRAKNAIAEALNKLECSDEDFFWRGARYVQLEPGWGGSKDTAAPLRVACAFGLVRTRAFGLLPFLVDLLCDPEKTARIGAAQALAYSEADAAYLVLRLKARLGDPDPEVVSECFNSLVHLKPEEGVSFVAEFLDAHDGAVQEAAILALGDSRRREAFEFLKAFWEKCGDPRLQEIVLMALSLLRLAPATDFLLTLVGTANQAVASAALSALALHRYDERLRERAALAASGRTALLAHFEKCFLLKDGSQS
jgi:HEAT repeat protein